MLGPGTSLVTASTEFLIQAPLIGPAVSWRFSIDPDPSVADPTRNDNRLPLDGSTVLQTVDVAPLHTRFRDAIKAFRLDTEFWNYACRVRRRKNT